MTEINKTKMIDDLVSAALEAYFQDEGGRAVINELLKAKEDGLSFNQLKERTKLNPSSLQRRLGSYVEAGLVENFLKKTGGTRFYSQYRLTVVGKIVSKEVESLENLLRKKVTARLDRISEVPGIIQVAE